MMPESESPFQPESKRTGKKSEEKNEAAENAEKQKSGKHNEANESEKYLNRGKHFEETDREKAHAVRGENLTEQEFAERAELIKELRENILKWMKENNAEGNLGDRRLLKQLTNFVSVECAETVNKITAHFLDRRMYPKRPVIKLMFREIGKIPDVLIFGWRGTDGEGGKEATKIHDHADSSVSLTVHQGKVEEEVYHLKRGEWKDRQVGQTMSNLGSVTTRLGEGASKTYASPYVHTVGGTADNDLSVSIHAYWRPSSQVAYDFRIDGDKFIEIGIS